MCQAYEDERAGIVDSEHRATIKGFAAAKFNKPQSSNPFTTLYFSYERDAWNQGWECWQERLLPYALEKMYHQKGQYKEAQDAREKFKETGELLPELEKIVKQYRKST